MMQMEPQRAIIPGSNVHSAEESWMKEEVSTGTTLFAMEFADGVVIAADSRTSTGVEMGEMPLVQTAANCFREICYNYRDTLIAGIICAGWDKQEGGQVYSIPLGGMLVRQPLTMGGSGSTYVYGFIDSYYKPKMSKEEAVDFATKAVALAISRDGSSGGIVRLGVITKDGIERRIVPGDKLPKFYQG
ncbi:unnamed protein product [Darwinula stevensoni]|uniref:Proteasome endopeptidase complex n=1 Tax=Darwinula stevensoni TaxID=69355 RepID=A0A7R8XCX3_9CRUS|nr:unnamed protein product [Darwinula stevensoni]CAG0893740.1 unnamed protein product [Darwinula stevensoni]